jgi:hypothetical protein
MKKKWSIWIVLLLNVSISFAQNSDTLQTSDWKISSDVNFYLIPNNFFILPVIKADKKNLHLEARYNYEDLNTFSVWTGYNFNGGKQLEYVITPMIGGVAGNSNGIAPGLELNMNYRKFSLYYETEYFIDLKENENNFIYAWSDFTYSPKEWLWFGLSAQRTRLYQTDLDIQRGLLFGGGIKNFEINGYLYNLFFDDPFGIITLGYNF